jgi:hypothetical protein
LLKSKSLFQNYLEIQNFISFSKFKELSLKAQGTSLVASKVKELIKETFQNIQGDYIITLEQALTDLETKIEMIKNL